MLLIPTGAIPIGIAVGRQRLQESNQAAQQLQAKDLNRFGLSMADLGEFDYHYKDYSVTNKLRDIKGIL